ncbi:helix-turn-helix domain-containing protein [Actinophytocola algeriensis]|uniref:AraC-like DNA-binding protein n=1 Tax=Actinophytocola algeriensis TaxID=1768010 RepID=A0A7W7Q1T7_9PSEU|nr:AraC family transcriptional regulator [Actinophytocola algeriensis]MBB4905391.1 AraC-like DNA-binding protein [Actinophytocola algeriensis]MBE1472924.1 AraC-like DNA-binding protein [Actinophytocola algeriensis]
MPTRTRQVANDDREPANPLISIETDLEPGLATGQHTHPDHLIAWSATATVSVRTGTRDWLVPPTHALWIPARLPHTTEVRRPGRGYAVIVARDEPSRTWPEPTGLLVTPLIRELVIHLDRHPDPLAVPLLLSLLDPVPSTTFHVPLPTDDRIRAIADALLADPADQRDLTAWAHATNTGVRTVTRLFAAETGMTFARWRTLVRIRAALTHLAGGASVGATARAVGYRKPGAFAETFHRVTGHHPGVYRTG